MSKESRRMQLRRIISLSAGTALTLTGFTACGGGSGDGGDGSATMSSSVGITESTDTGGDGDGDEDGDGGDPCPPGGCLDVAVGGTGDDGGPGIGTGAVDLLFVIDNSGTMAEEQVNLAQNFAGLVEQLNNLEDSMGNPVQGDIQIMVTTTDMDHSLCTDFHPTGYTPAKGAPVATPCLDRLSDFQNNTSDAFGSCLSVCEQSVTLQNGDQFIKWNGDNTNINATDLSNNPLSGVAAVTAALECIGPQGISGCGYEAPLEAMIQALNPSQDWNSGVEPFLRDGSLLAIAVVTDEADCSTRPDGQIYFYDQMFDDYWPVDPDTMTKKRATSATCWHAGVDCGTPDMNGIYADCTAADNGVLHSVYERYVNYLKNALNRDVIMLGILGVPEVTSHNPEPPFEPTAGGVLDLVYRDWQAADILAGDTDTAEDKTFDFGIGPGCTNIVTGQAIPPVRVREVCESLDEENSIKCCIESICDDDFSPAIGCLTGAIEETIVPAG